MIQRILARRGHLITEKKGALVDARGDVFRAVHDHARQVLGGRKVGNYGPRRAGTVMAPAPSPLHSHARRPTADAHELQLWLFRELVDRWLFGEPGPYPQRPPSADRRDQLAPLTPEVCRGPASTAYEG